MQERKPRVLVVDDERHIRGLLHELLSRWGYHADIAADGLEGLSLLTQGGYDLILTDFAMPGVSGLELVERLRRMDRRAGVIVFTGASVDLDGHDARLDFTLLRKPLQIEQLESEVRQVLSARPAV